MSNKITTGLNDRPKDETIAQSGAGLPDDSGTPIDVSEEDVERVRAKLMGGRKAPDASQEKEP